MYRANLRFRTSNLKKRILLIQLKLLDSGNVDRANEVERMLNSSSDRDATLESLEAEVEDARRVHWLDGRSRLARRLLVKDFVAANNAKGICDHCQAPCPKIRKDGYTKFFIKDVNKRQKLSLVDDGMADGGNIGQVNPSLFGKTVLNGLGGSLDYVS